MGYCIRRDEPVADGIRRIALEQIDKAVRSLAEPEEGRHKGVHEARKACKKLRALLRLARGALGAEAYRRENLFVRDAQRELSAVRDTAAIIESLDKLTAHFADQLDGQAFARLRATLVERCRAIEAEQMDKGDMPARVAKQLDGARERIAAWHLSGKGNGKTNGKGMAMLRPGLHRVYRDGRQLFRALDAGSDAHAWHDWRKQVKYFWYHTRILCPLWPGPLDALSDELERVSDLVGHDHDLVVLRDIAASSDLDATTAEALAALVERRCRELRHEAMPIGLRLYADRPSDVVDRFGVYWKAWHGSVLAPAPAGTAKRVAGVAPSRPAAA
ncbi:CHAD domain-containing protein [Azospirillum rugosum]|uniref:CHAD domain-containing protein n=1 Tax=Azospirillum rugosum TaxID=416170 RepID=A0ABS4SRS2_9PROT|nr:CHAD domain-containing protein [Azospirillum rugosum]MBP2295266.1 CHAD domain-containing protein [Azospirillum rugosum]MDQ0528641.1 CHAD domain-containing protein [Azospirillum rugosum]